MFYELLIKKNSLLPKPIVKSKVKAELKHYLQTSEKNKKKSAMKAAKRFLIYSKSLIQLNILITEFNIT